MVYLDSGASAQKPQAVLDAMDNMYTTCYANVHRGIYRLSEQATQKYEDARVTVAKFVNAAPDEIVFTGGATESLNLAAYTLAHSLSDGDEIVTTVAEHHSNIVPWQITGKKLKFNVVDCDDSGSFSLDDFKRAIVPGRTKIVTIPHVSNVLGTVFPVKEIARLAHEAGAIMVVDGCQGVVHCPADMRDLGCDFYAFSAHKLYGPTGMGVLYIKRDVAAKLPPFLGGGDMIKTVSFDGSTYADPPARFEAGTPKIVQAVGLAAAIDYLRQFDKNEILAHEKALLDKLVAGLSSIAGLRLIGTAMGKASLQAFAIEGVNCMDIAAILDKQGICVRAGHHCAMPLHARFGITASVRASFGIYNSLEDIDSLVAGLQKAVGMLR